MSTFLIILCVVFVLALIRRHHRGRYRIPLTPSTNMVSSSTGVGLGAGTYEFKIDVGGEQRKYLVHAPPGYTREHAVPLVVFFHGGGGWMEQAASDYGWIEKSDREGCIVVFPNGSGRMPRGRFATWNAGNCCGYARDQNIDDVGFTRALINDVSAKFTIDKERIFATGMSNGGMMAHRLACEMADTFRAVASVAGTDGTLACTPSRPISVLHIHAKNDDHVLFDGGAGEEAFRDRSKVTNFTSVADTVSRWVERNHLNVVPTRVLDVPGAYCDLYSSTENPAQVKLCVTEIGGHSWPGGKEVRGKTPSRAIIANDVIWDFFRDQAR